MRHSTVQQIEHSLGHLLMDVRHQPACNAVIRLAVALYHERENTLHSVAAALCDSFALSNYMVEMDQVPSLAILAGSFEPRIVNDLRLYERDLHTHTDVLREHGIRSSLIVPLNGWDGHFLGFVFFNACQYNAFNSHSVHCLLPLAEQAMATCLQILQDCADSCDICIN